MKKITVLIGLILTTAYAQTEPEETRDSPVLLYTQGQTEAVVEEPTREPPAPLYTQTEIEPREAPIELYTAPNENNKEAENPQAGILSKANEEMIEDLKPHISNYSDKSLESLIKRLNNSIWLNEKLQWPLHDFFYKKKNRLSCDGIQITDAAQEFDDGEIYFTIKFKITKDDNAQQRIPVTVLNNDVRRKFAVYAKSGKEVAFYSPRNISGEKRYTKNNIYRARYKTTLYNDAGDTLSNIKCAKRRMKMNVLNPNGKYQSIPLPRMIP